MVVVVVVVVVRVVVNEVVVGKVVVHGVGDGGDYCEGCDGAGGSSGVDDICVSRDSGSGDIGSGDGSDCLVVVVEVLLLFWKV